MLRLFLIFIFCFFWTLNSTAANPDSTVEKRNFQLSVFPYVGTEGAYSHNYIYNISLNLFAGITGGVDGIELGGLVNINRYTMKGLQGSGFGNIVNGNTDGIQLAGFFNVNNSYTNGFQGAGFINVVNNSAKIFQASGFTNVINGNINGAQASGFANVVSGDAEVLQAAGFVNVTGGKMNGLQAAGFANIASEAEGVQLAGFINVAERIKGMQLGFINVADTIDGIPIGFISVVKRGGYKKFELSGGDVMNLNVGFKLGVRRFYNFLTMGAQFIGDNSVYSYGYGFGSEFYMSDSRYLNIEIGSQNLVKQKLWRSERLTLLNQLKVSYARDIDERWQIFAGPVLNVLVSGKNNGESGLIDPAPYHIVEYEGSRADTKIWIGLNAGLRFW
jgi:hypothetical protein